MCLGMELRVVVGGGEMIEDGMPEHWPKMLGDKDDPDVQSATRVLAKVRSMIIDYRKRRYHDWRIQHAQSSTLVDVVAGLIADAEAIDRLFDEADKRARKLQDENSRLREELAESKRPFSAQMEMQNRRIIALTNELDRLSLERNRDTNEAEAK